jgi:hypothetical protein
MSIILSMASRQVQKYWSMAAQAEEYVMQNPGMMNYIVFASDNPKLTASENGSCASADVLWMVCTASG